MYRTEMSQVKKMGKVKSVGNRKSRHKAKRTLDSGVGTLKRNKRHPTNITCSNASRHRRYRFLFQQCLGKPKIAKLNGTVFEYTTGLADNNNRHIHMT
jgi:hypothetical protein